MKPVYASVSPSRDLHLEQLVELMIAPREWLQQNPVIDFETNMVIEPLAFVAAKSFLVFQCVEETLRYEEEPKTTAAGRFYEVQIMGQLNYSDAELNHVLETLSYHELVVLVKDQRKQYRLVGTKDFGMRMTVGTRITPDNAGTLRRMVELTMNVEQMPPYYLYGTGSSS